MVKPTVKRTPRPSVARQHMPDESTDAVTALIDVTRDPSPQVRAAALHSLGNIGDSRAASALSEALTDTSKNVRYEARRALDRLHR